MKFAKFKKGIFVSQRKNVLDLFEETGLLSCKSVETIMKPNLRLQLVCIDKVVNCE